MNNRPDHLAKVSASLHNRTIDAIESLNTIQMSGAYTDEAPLVFHRLTSRIHWTENALVLNDVPPGGWALDKSVEPKIGSLPPEDIATAYADACVYRLAGATWLTGGDILYGTDTSNPYGCVPAWFLGNKISAEDPSAVPITETPDNWTYPGGYNGSVPYVDNPAKAGGTSSAGWQHGKNNTETWRYDFAPVVLPIGETGNFTSGGPTFHPVYGVGRISPLVAKIHVNALPFGPNEFLRNCQHGTTITNAVAQVKVTGYEALKKVHHQTAYASMPTITTTTTGNDVSLVLLGGYVTGSGSAARRIWEPVGGSLPVTLTDGKWAVVDVTGLVQRLLDLCADDSRYDSFALIPGNAADLVGKTDAREILRGMVKNPTLAYDETADDWWVTDAEWSQTYWDTIEWNIVFTFAYPDGSSADHVLGINLPAAI